MQWILWIIAVTANGQALVVDKMSFGDAASCAAAASQVQEINGTAIGSNARVESTCLRTTQ